MSVTLWLILALLTAFIKIKISLYISPDLAQLGNRLDCIQKVADSSPLCATIFFHKCSLVGICVFTDEDPHSEWMKRDESNTVY